MKKILTVGLFLCTTLTFAVEGRVTYISGPTKIEHQGKKQPLKLGAKIVEGDIVSTSAKAKVGIQMSDGASFFINPLTTLEIRPGSRYYQANGTVSMLFQKSKHATNKWVVKTPVVTAGVRGTGFTVEAGKSSTRVVLFTGKLIMTDFVRESGLQSDPNLMMQDFLNDIELNAGTAFVYDGNDVKKSKINLTKEPMRQVHEEHQKLVKSASWKKIAQELP